MRSTGSQKRRDALLHHVENGLTTLIGGAAENPSFVVIPALLSRRRVITLKGLSPEHLGAILDRAVKDRERGYGGSDLDIPPTRWTTWRGSRAATPERR